jgi:hypothetical protein
MRFFFEMIRTVLVLISRNNEMPVGFNYIFKSLDAKYY